MFIHLIFSSFYVVSMDKNMQDRIEITPPSSPRALTPRELEERRLRNEAAGSMAAPAKPGSFFANKRKEIIEQYVRDGLDKFDQQQDEELMFEMDF